VSSDREFTTRVCLVEKNVTTCVVRRKKTVFEMSNGYGLHRKRLFPLLLYLSADSCNIGASGLFFGNFFTV